MTATIRIYEFIKFNYFLVSIFHWTLRYQIDSTSPTDALLHGDINKSFKGAHDNIALNELELLKHHTLPFPASKFAKACTTC